MKTAIQELICTLKELQFQLNIPIEVIDMCENQLDVEKEQIIQAHIDGFDHIVVDFKKQEYAEQYYNQTYNQNES